MVSWAEKVVTAAPPAPHAAPTGDLGSLIGALLTVPDRVAKLEHAFHVDIDALVAEAVKRTQQPMKLEVFRAPETAPIVLEAQHKSFATLLTAAQARVNCWLAGPSGSGKTTAAQSVAKALDLPYYYTGAVHDPYSLMGYMNATGSYVGTLWRKAYEQGGVFLWDEVDGSSPNALVAFNAALANGHAAFPDAMVERHPDCVVIAAANTWGHGATREYVGRNKIDGATLKRFAFIDWPYDETLELETAPNRTWTKRVQAVRAKVEAKGLRVLVTPRESYIGAKLLAAGLDQDTVENMTIRSGMTDDQWAQVRK
jgi:hypothetical protein